MTDESEKMHEPAHVTDVLGPCPDCDGGVCTMTCEPGTLTFREVVAAAVLEMEAAKSEKAHASIVRLLNRINPNLLLSAAERYATRKSLAPASGTEEKLDVHDTR